jgi:hypothetical protein
VIIGVGNELFGLPLHVSGPKGSFPTIAAATRLEKIRVRRDQLREFGLRAVMIDAEAVLSLESVRQSTVYTLGRELLLEKWFVGGIRGVRGRLKPSSITGFRVDKRI